MRIIRKIFSHTFKIIERFIRGDGYIFADAYRMCDCDLFFRLINLRSNLVHTFFNAFMNFKS